MTSTLLPVAAADATTPVDMVAAGGSRRSSLKPQTGGKAGGALDADKVTSGAAVPVGAPVVYECPGAIRAALLMMPRRPHAVVAKIAAWLAEATNPLAPLFTGVSEGRRAGAIMHIAQTATLVTAAPGSLVSPGTYSPQKPLRLICGSDIGPCVAIAGALAIAYQYASLEGEMPDMPKYWTLPWAAHASLARPMLATDPAGAQAMSRTRVTVATTAPGDAALLVVPKDVVTALYRWSGAVPGKAGCSGETYVRRLARKVLKRNPLLGSLHVDDRVGLAALAPIVQVARFQQLQPPDDGQASIFLVVGGKLAVRRGNGKRAMVEAGHMVGVGEAFHENRGAECWTMAAMEDETAVLVIPRSFVVDLSKRCPEGFGAPLAMAVIEEDASWMTPESRATSEQLDVAFASMLTTGAIPAQLELRTAAETAAARCDSSDTVCETRRLIAAKNRLDMLCAEGLATCPRDSADAASVSLLAAIDRSNTRRARPGKLQRRVSMGDRTAEANPRPRYENASQILKEVVSGVQALVMAFAQRMYCLQRAATAADIVEEPPCDAAEGCEHLQRPLPLGTRSASIAVGDGASVQLVELAARVWILEKHSRREGR